MKILLVEDSERLRRSLGIGLRAHGHAVDAAADGEQALAFARGDGYDAVILDLMLPKLDGLSVLGHLRDRGDATPVLILSARDKVEDRIRGLDLGADDYLIKPFSLDELLARIRALIRRHTGSKLPVIAMGQLQVDTIRREVSHAGIRLDLTVSEYQLFEYLLLRRGRAISHGRLIECLHDACEMVSKNSIEVHICQLRKKLKAAGAPAMIVTRRGFGYLIE